MTTYIVLVLIDSKGEPRAQWTSLSDYGWTNGFVNRQLSRMEKECVKNTPNRVESFPGGINY